jgi:ATP-dependent DNA helicase RecQ
MGWDAAVYHAGLSSKQREWVLNQFQAGDLEIVVATNAFGMGIDRSDVRAVIHLAAPGSIEAYYQEVGRAGRDGENAYGLLLTSASDLPRRRHLLESPLDGIPPSPEVVEHKWNLFLELMRWSEGGSCRHDAILRYFGDEAESLDGCGLCDICLSLNEPDEHSTEEAHLIIRKALSGVARIHGRFGLNAAIQLLRGKADDRLFRAGLDQISTFGILSEHPEEWLLKVLRRCVTAGWVSFYGGDRPLAILTEAGISAMKGERPIRLILPPKRRRSSARSSKGTSERVSTHEFCANVQDLFEELREFRLKEARKEGVPPYVVASDRTLRDLATLKPRNLEELRLAHGIGPTKAEKYGAGLLRVISNY